MIKETIIKGFTVWKNNLLLGLPYLMESVITTLIFLIIVIGVVFYITPITQEIREIQEILKDDVFKRTKEEKLNVAKEKYEKVKEMVFKILVKLDKNLNTLIGIAIFDFLITYAFISFFRCVEIKYCLDALGSKKDLRKAFFKAKNKWFNVYVFYLVMNGMIFGIAGITFLFTVFPNYKGINFFEYAREEIISFIASSILFIFVVVTVVAIVSFFLVFAPYAIVIDDAPTLISIKKSVSIVKKNFWTVTIFWLVGTIPVFVASLLITPIRFLITGIAGMIVSHTVLCLLIAFFLQDQL